MNHGSLFSGIGGFDLAAEWMGWNNMFHCEWNEFGKRILKYYWPNAISYGDITKTDFTIWRGRIDILTGGFPCQPFSVAGQRKGTEDARHLWPEMLRAIRECQPAWIVGENVPGLISWSKGLVLEQVCIDLEGEGYEVQPVVLPACGVNAPHRRDRVWIVAYNTDARIKGLPGSKECGNGLRTIADTKSERVGRLSERKNEEYSVIGINGYNLDASNTNSPNNKARSHREVLGQQNRKEANGYSNVECRNKWQDFPTQSPVCNGNDGISERLDSISFPKWRNESIKAGGNAIVPQVAYQIFKVIEQMSAQNRGNEVG